MRWKIPRELLWAIIVSLSVMVVAFWPLKYPYAQSPQTGEQHETVHSRSDNAPEIQILGIKPGEWLLSIVTLMLWAATVGLVRSADRTAERQLRPYFDLRSSEVEDFEIGQKPKITLRFRNVGQTPAIDVMCRLNIQVRDYGNEPPCIDVRVPLVGPKAIYTSKSTIGRDGTLTSHLRMSDPLSQYSFEAVKDDNAAFFAWGIIRYSDVFGNSRYFRFRVAFTADKVAVGDGNMEVCNEGNDAN